MRKSRLPNPLTDPRDIERRIERARKLSTLGDLCRWGADEVEVPPSDLDAILERRGIKDYAPVDIRRRKAARKAIAKVRAELETEDVKVLMRRMWENDQEVRYALVDETVDLDDEDIDFETRNQVSFLKDQGILRFRDGVIPAIQEKFDHYCGVYTRSEVLRIVKNIVEKNGGISLRDRSGFYFLPATMQDETNGLKDFLNKDINGHYGRSYFRAFALMDDQQNKDGIAQVFSADIEVELQEAQEALERILKGEAGEEGFATRSMRMALKRYNAAAGKAEMYTELLGITREDLSEVIEQGKGMLREMLLDAGELVEADTDTDEDEDDN